MTPQSQRRHPRRRWASLLCLLAYLSGTADFLPEVLGFLCALDPSHTVYVVRDSSDVRIVLTHEKGRATDATYRAEQDPASGQHRHGLVAGLLCDFGSTSRDEADHSASFGSGSAFEPSEDDGFKPHLAKLARTLMDQFQDGELPSWGNFDSRPWPSDAPQPLTGPLHCLRSVVLLI